MTTITDPQVAAVEQSMQLTDSGSSEPVGSPLWWLCQLEADLVRRYPLVRLYEDYSDGRHQVTFVSSKYREAFGQALAAVNDNWMPLIVRAGVERLGVQGLLLKDDTPGTKEAFRIWERNELDQDAPLLFTEAAKIGEAYTLTWPDRPRPGIFGRFFSRKSGPEALITVEHPSQMIVRREPGQRRRVAAALKRWIDDDGTYVAYLYLPDKIYRFSRTADSKWKPLEQPGAPAESPNPFGEVPVAPIVNDPQMCPSYPPLALLCAPHYAPKVAIGLGRSDLADSISTQDQINLLLCHFLVNSEFRSFIQRWATGIDVPVDPQTKQPLDEFKAAVERIWATKSKDARFGSFPQDDPQPILAGIDGRILSLASRTRTPAHYLPRPTGNYPSGESLKAAETSLVAKVGDKKVSYGGGLRATMRFAFMATGDRQRAATPVEIDWRNSESRSESEFVDSLVKKLAFGVPPQQLWKEAGYSPNEIDAMRAMMRDQDFLAALANAGHPLGQGDPEPPALPAPADAG